MANRPACPRCGHANTADAPFCGTCGERLWSDDRTGGPGTAKAMAAGIGQEFLPRIAFQLAFWLGTAGMVIGAALKAATGCPTPILGMMVKAWLLGGLLRIPLLHVLMATFGLVKF